MAKENLRLLADLVVRDAEVMGGVQTTLRELQNNCALATSTFGFVPYRRLLLKQIARSGLVPGQRQKKREQRRRMSIVKSGKFAGGHVGSRDAYPQPGCLTIFQHTNPGPLGADRLSLC